MLAIAHTRSDQLHASPRKNESAFMRSRICKVKRHPVDDRARLADRSAPSHGVGLAALGIAFRRNRRPGGVSDAARFVAVRAVAVSSAVDPCAFGVVSEIRAP